MCVGYDMIWYDVTVSVSMLCYERMCWYDDMIRYERVCWDLAIAVLGIEMRAG